ncbi:MAG: hypothetical protein LQ346_005732 [Caloplaca aetnensis]|nr:MAG: hypothetical protein LQ346_005732 [Caloplaca aetnensis]
MPTRIRGGTPIDDDEAREEAHVLADLAEINQYFRTQRAQYLQEAREQALADYQPPPYSPTPESERSTPEGDLPTPSTTPPPVCTFSTPERNHKFRPKTNLDPQHPLLTCVRGRYPEAYSSGPLSRKQMPTASPESFGAKPAKNLPAINHHDKIESLATYDFHGAGHVCSARSERGLHSKRVERLGPSYLTLLDPYSTIYKTFEFQRRQEAPDQETGSG